MTDNELTALQTVIQDRETAAQMLEDLDGIEDDHHDADEGTPLRWALKLEVGEEDLPKIRDELREYAHGGD